MDWVVRLPRRRARRNHPIKSVSFSEDRNTLTNPLTPADRQAWVVARASRDLLLLVVSPCTAPDDQPVMVVLYLVQPVGSGWVLGGAGRDAGVMAEAFRAVVSLWGKVES